MYNPARGNTSGSAARDSPKDNRCTPWENDDLEKAMKKSKAAVLLALLALSIACGSGSGSSGSGPTEMSGDWNITFIETAGGVSSTPASAVFQLTSGNCIDETGYQVQGPDCFQMDGFAPSSSWDLTGSSSPYLTLGVPVDPAPTSSQVNFAIVLPNPVNIYITTWVATGTVSNGQMSGTWTCNATYSGPGFCTGGNALWSGPQF
jgi:hypothetical protein